MPDEVDLLLDQLKALPLIESTDLDAEFAAYDAFELVLSAITRAALVQVPQDQRKSQNRQLFEQFVVDCFPAGRGGGDGEFARRLWNLRCNFVKEHQTGQRFALVHNHPELHWQRAGDARRLLDLQSLISDFREAVDNLDGLLRSTPALREVAREELERRAVQLVPVRLPRLGLGVTSASATSSSSTTISRP